jgi:hypothetical protein
MEKMISLKKTRADAEKVYREGRFYCSEAVVSAIRENIAPEMPEALIAATGGFPVGAGRCPGVLLCWVISSEGPCHHRRKTQKV